MNSLFNILKITLDQISFILNKSNEEISQIKATLLDQKMKMMRQKKETDMQRQEALNFHKINNIYLAKIQKLQEELKYQNDKLKSIFKDDQESINFISNIEKNQTEGPPILSDVLLQELIEQQKINPYARKYSNTIKNVAFIIFSYSPCAYRKVSEFFPLPSERTLRDSFKAELNSTKENLLNIKQIKVILDQLHKLYTHDDNQKIPAVLAADGATMNPRKTGNSGFIAYQLQPTDRDLKDSIVHVSLKKNSHFDDVSISKAHEIADIAKNSNFDIFMLATDADTKTNKMHKNFYDFLMKIPGTFENKLEKMKEYGKEFPGSDMLHLVKAMKRKFLDNYIQMTPFSP